MIDFEAQIKAEAAASDKSSTEMMTDIITDLRRHNYGIAEYHVAIMIARLEQEEHERQEAHPAESEPGTFKQIMQGFIKNLEMEIPDTPHYEYFVGMKNAYRYALEIYKETR